VKIGDLVRPKLSWIEGIGIIIETGLYTGNADVKIMWEDGAVDIAISNKLDVISEI
tara:strand:- start:793 stop:960 length:168 start_codon:yes stop_codon:yes gene_type:complete